MDFSFADLVADVPLAAIVVVSGVSARVDPWLAVLGGRVVGKTEFDLGEGGRTLRSFC